MTSLSDSRPLHAPQHTVFSVFLGKKKKERKKDMIDWGKGAESFQS